MRSGKYFLAIKPDTADLFGVMFSTRGDAHGYYLMPFQGYYTFHNRVSINQEGLNANSLMQVL